MRFRAAALSVAAFCAVLTLAPAGEADAHPLGNFTVNHYDGLVLHHDRVDDLVVVDAAEIPTYQARYEVDSDHNGTVSPREAEAAAARQCAAVADAVLATVDGRALRWRVVVPSLTYRPGAIGLPTSRLTCALSAAADLSKPRTVHLTDSYSADRIGWREVTAVGAGVRLVRSSVPVTSVSQELRHYPNDLLSSPLVVREAVVLSRPGPGASGAAAQPALTSAGPATRLVSAMTVRFNRLVGERHLTATVGLAALGLSVLLGAAHAALPGHGKTVMAAYLAGRRGNARDALLVGATVTVTHTGGVLALGVLLSASASLAGDGLIRDLGVVSGLLVVVVGVTLLRSALQGLHHRGHPHHHDEQHAHGHVHPGEETDRFSRGGLVGLGVAGGLVPSPSALVVLLGAVALGRTAFGVLLVLGYGIGMALTLTAAGLLLVQLRHRFERSTATRRAAFLDRLARITPLATASVVVLVGMALAARGLAPTP